MSNCISTTGFFHFMIDVRDEEKVVESLHEAMSCDNDLTENVDYFRPTTLKLGYESEADRIVKEYIKKKGVPKDLKSYKKAYEKMVEKISSQEYFGECHVDFVDVDEHRTVVMFIYGGDESGQA